jgi:ABC-type Fe3+/spermidine/putrescine transport system ATPase subunit
MQPDGGEIHLNGERVIGPEEQLIPGHPGIAYLSQHFELRHHLWVHEIMAYANELSDEEAKELYAICRIQHLFNRRTDQLSGGESQRIALARLLTTKPTILLLDEPFSNLDIIHKNIIKKVITDIGEKLGITCMMVSHDAPDILSWADTILVMKDGAIIQQGTPQTIYRQPVNEYCAGLFGDFNLIGNTKASAFAAIEMNGKNLLIRPEQFNIVTTNHNAVAATVQSVLYHGSHYSIEVMVDENLISVYSNSNQFKTGDKIYLSLNAEDVIYLAC